MQAKAVSELMEEGGASVMSHVIVVFIALSSSNDDEEVGMKPTLEKEEREELAGITRKGSHQSQKVINALILLNCDEGEFNEHRARGEAIAEILRISARASGFVEEGMDGTRGRQGRRPRYLRKADGRGALVALSCGASAGPTAVAGSRRGARPHRQRVAETVRRVLRTQTVAAGRLGEGSADFAAMEKVLDVASLRCGLSGGV